MPCGCIHPITMLTGAVMFALFVLLSGAFGFVSCKSRDYYYHEQAGVFLKLHTTPANWADARLRCYNEGAVLASPEDASLWSVMQTNLKAIWTGIQATYSARKGDYHSIKGTPLNRLNVEWGRGKPGDRENLKDCLLMVQPNGTITDADCLEAYPYICYTKNYVKCEVVNTGYTFSSLTGSCYKFHKDPKDWYNAFATCTKEGGHLSIINGATEARVLVQMCDMNQNYLDSLEVLHSGYIEWSHGQWMTIKGKTLEEAGWSSFINGSLNHKNSTECSTRCGTMRKQDGYLWDGICSTRRLFICEKGPYSQKKLINGALDYSTSSYETDRTDNDYYRDPTTEYININTYDRWYTHRNVSWYPTTHIRAGNNDRSDYYYY